ncbi:MULTISPECIES: K+/H+ antiporter subunit F [Thalassospira]|jgi:multicomponent K+:H+ antiporter subunit F|uniref:K+/H+ antiporter subunit F n=2 Tax=Thalassospira TaxID=168934 RepID=A0A358HTE6_9PROT|nr:MULTISPECIES: K+/H+ antiporter subunit F [Thalassospira]MBV16469.1 K+/H+ antiporter subunit F [Thalassospira sp.]PKR59969.1 K+/H+ antiporter subunit F [Thalassospira lohafexi]RCK30646.1 cation:proton antiporter [Thalassospira lucentensis MCCC 1A00383 = DSM 14000]HBU98443.1 K+/H+ antiporter subunit F [Thalassospira lucentensis]HCW68111.1 K+/H+ antiporter subunit F [Thalassospira lucentensis]|tara:strand:+ start:97 stop:366 length:270 start_codon:yes stop_codon:yes gene_type:complete
MIEYALNFGFVCVSLALLMNLWRLTMGPTTADRILAVDTMAINAIALLVMYGIAKGTAMYFEGALLFAMFGFVSTVAYCKFILRGDIIE